MSLILSTKFWINWLAFKSVNTDCKFIYKWADNDNSTDFVIAGNLKPSASRYLAMGFSKDASMVRYIIKHYISLITGILILREMIPLLFA